MGVGYSIDPRVQGSISLSSGKPVPKTDLLFVLENALRMSNVVLIRDTAGYRIIPMGDAVGGGNTDADGGPGRARLRRLRAAAALRVRRRARQAARTRSRCGPAWCAPIPGATSCSSRAPVRSGAPSWRPRLGFDVDWMRGQSVGIFPVQNSSPEPIIAELEKISIPAKAA